MLEFVKSGLLATGLTLTMAAAAPAATVSFQLNAKFLNGPLVGSPIDPVPFTVSYDDADLTYGTVDDGDGTLSPQESLEIAVPGFPDFETVDVGYPRYPEVVFEDYIPISIDFLIDSFTLPQLAFFGIRLWRVGGEVTTDVNNPDLFALVYDPTTNSYSTGSTVIAPIPLPAGLPLLALGLGAIALAARRHRARA